MSKANSFKVHCEVCGKHQLVNPIQLRKDRLNKKPWGDIVCSECHFVIATISADVEGDIILEGKVF